MVEDYFKTKAEKLAGEIPELKRMLEKCPKGTIVACKIKGKYRWYQQYKNKNGDYDRAYIGQKDIELARQLAQKAYMTALLKDKENELYCIKKYMKSRKPSRHKELLRSDSPYRELIGAERWDLQEYEKNQSHPENLIVKAPKGEFVRSKSEALIANALFDCGIQYRYECRLDLGEIICYPDFMIKCEKSNKLVIWEHFGMIDDPVYFENMMKKIRLFISNGYLPGDQLIMTFESRANPLTIDVVQEVISRNLV